MNIPNEGGLDSHISYILQPVHLNFFLCLHHPVQQIISFYNSKIYNPKRAIEVHKYLNRHPWGFIDNKNCRILKYDKNKKRFYIRPKYPQ